MKRLLYLGIILMFCALDFNIKAQNSTDETEEVTIPCLDGAFDSENRVAAWGVGVYSDMEVAAELAFQDAAQSMAQRFHISSKKISPLAGLWCRQYTVSDNGMYVVYVTIVVNKDVLLKIIQNN